MSESEGPVMARRRRGNTPASPASLPDGDDLLWEILLRLPPQPSSLPRASAVCKRWQRIVMDPHFLCCFRIHHRRPPLLGFFKYHVNKIVFRSILDYPDCIPPERFDFGRYSVRHDTAVLGCWHGRVLVLDHMLKEVAVCTPLTGEQRRVAIPPEFQRGLLTGAVLCAASDQDHMHGGCHSSPFKVALVSMLTKKNQLIARVYSSETGIWDNLISSTTPYRLYTESPATRVGNALYWLLYPRKDGILEFDLEEQSLVVTRGPPVIEDYSRGHRLIQGEDGAIGFVRLSYPQFQIWQRNVNGHGVATWVLWKAVELYTILGLPPRIEGSTRGIEFILGYSEDADIIFIFVGASVYMVHLKSMESKKLNEKYYAVFDYYPFTSFYAPGATIAGICNGATTLHNT